MIRYFKWRDETAKPAGGLKISSKNTRSFGGQIGSERGVRKLGSFAIFSYFEFRDFGDFGAILRFLVN